MSRDDFVSTLPDAIRVGPHDIAVLKMSPAWAGASNAFGEFSDSESVIRLQANMPTPHKAVEVVIHEISHAIFDVYGLNVDDDEPLTEERIVHVMGAGWAQVFRDNTDLLEWIDETLNPEEADQETETSTEEEVPNS